MSTVKANMADYLTQIETLTKTNLQILKTINDSFFTKKNHLYADVNDTTYVIPSFISLENKINMLQENFENLVKAPETSEAYFNFDGNTRAIEVRKYSHVPDSLKLPLVTSYGVNSNNIFKDFLTPVPYINIDIPQIPNDIVEVNVKKIVAKSNLLKSLFASKLNDTISVNETYGNVYKMLLSSVKDIDYVEYDTIYKLPIRQNIGNATYVIESVVNDIIDEDLNELITLKLRNNLTDNSLTNTLTYKLFNDTIEKPLQVGDELINFDGTGKVVITEVRPATNTIVVKVVNGEYLNFVGTDSYDSDNDNDIHDMSKLRFHMTIDFQSDKYIKIPLEEDQYVFIAVAPINSRMNTQSSWGTGLIIDTYQLTNEKNGSFETHYTQNVKNIGDVLFEMTSMITDPVTALSVDNFNMLKTLKPTINPNLISVMHINRHLNNSTTVKNIRDAYNQKKLAEADLNEVQASINNINAQLSSISFDDTTGLRNMYSAQLTQLNNSKNELLNTINNAIDAISLNANASDVPIENAKYRIRGFYIPDFGTVNGINIDEHIIGIQVQYRYKNASSVAGTATSISDNNSIYVYSDWNVLPTFNKSKLPLCDANGNYSYIYEASNEIINEPSYNQIDIPISQGENVDIRIKVLYDFGQPFVSLTSDWSTIYNVTFPDEFTKDVPILTIIEENNNDIETNRFNNILENNGVNEHINDLMIDQNITYYHKPDHIASGFYTDERRIIPLKDKLMSLSNDVESLTADIYDTETNCRVSVNVGDAEILLYPDRDNTITLEPFSSFNSDNITDGSYIRDNNGVISVMLNISIANSNKSNVKLYSILPGPRDQLLNNEKIKNTYGDKLNGYIDGINTILFRYSTTNESKISSQGLNQFIMFRMKDLYTGESYYKQTADDKCHSYSTDYLNDLGGNSTAMTAYPYLSSRYGLCMSTDDKRTHTTINSSNELIIPIKCQYYIKEGDQTQQLQRTISFDLRTSLYSDPINYTFTIICKNTATVNDKLSIKNKKRLWDRLINLNQSHYNVTLK